MPLLNTTLISPGMLDSITLFFPSLCTIQTRTEVLDAAGQPGYTWADTFTGVPCRIAPASGNETRTPDESFTVGKWTCVLRGNYAVAPTMRAVVDGTDYNVIDVAYDDQAIQTRLMLEVVA